MAAIGCARILQSGERSGRFEESNMAAENGSTQSLLLSTNSSSAGAGGFTGLVLVWFDYAI